MKKNPRDDYRWLEEELLAIGEDEPESDEGESLDEDPNWWEEDGKIENPTVDWGRTVFDCGEYGGEFDEDAAVLAESKKQRRKRLKIEKKQAKRERKLRKKERKQKGIGGLVLLAILEVCGILAIIGWWIQWLT